MISFMLSPPEENGRTLVRRRAIRGCLRALLKSAGVQRSRGSGVGDQEVATEVWTGRGFQAAASVTKRSKMALEVGLMS